MRRLVWVWLLLLSFSAAGASLPPIEVHLGSDASVQDLDASPPQVIATPDRTRNDLMAWRPDGPGPHHYRFHCPPYDDHDGTMTWSGDSWLFSDQALLNNFRISRGTSLPMMYSVYLAVNEPDWSAFTDPDTQWNAEVDVKEGGKVVQHRVVKLERTGNCVHLPSSHTNIYVTAPGFDCSVEHVRPGQTTAQTPETVTLLATYGVFHYPMFYVSLGIVALGLGLGARRFLRASQARRQETLHSIQLSAIQDFDRDGSRLLPTDRRIGPYTVTGKLGAGGMAAVYAVVDNQGLTYALKLPNPDSLQDAGTRERFLRECKLCTALKHPNIVRTFEGGTYESAEGLDVPYMVMELVKGTTLDNVMRARVAASPEPSVPFAVKIIRDVLEGLKFAHTLNVVHRDIKPTNVMYTEAEQAKLMDFGIAHMASEKTLTATGMVIGTPAYMAPEQASQGKVIDQRADIYAAGVLFYQLLSYQLPFTDSSGDPWQVLVRKMSEPSPMVDAVNPRVVPALSHIVATMLAGERDNRYPDAQAVLDALTDLTG